MSTRLILAPVQAEAFERRGTDRRRESRRAPTRTFDAHFAMTLVNQVAPAEAVYMNGYQAQRGPRPGIAFNLSA